MSDDDGAPAVKPKKVQRISQACDLCHRRSIRCRPSNESPKSHCQNCFDFGVDCTYNRPSKRRRKSTGANVSPIVGTENHRASTNTTPTSDGDPGNKSVSRPATEMIITPGNVPDYTGAYGLVRAGKPADATGVAWRAFALASGPTIERYLEIFMEVLYPFAPFFHGPTLWERVKRREYLTDPGFLASVMAACAFAASRARDGAAEGRFTHTDTPEKLSEIFFAAAENIIDRDLKQAKSLDCLRAYGLLTMTAMQYGSVGAMHQHVGTYTTLCAMMHFHDEDRWPGGISPVEREERRRLFWSMYCLDVFISVVFDSIMKSQETLSNVRYPYEIDDEDLTTEGTAAYPLNENNWLHGFNFVTDLYRILELTIKRMRGIRDVRDDRMSITRLLIVDGIPEEQIMDNVIRIYHELPQIFKAYDLPLSGDRRQNLIGSQAANIQVTLQLVRMTVFSTNSQQNVNQKCCIAEQFLATYHEIAQHHLRAISIPLIHHLGSIGRILSSVMGSVLCEETYSRVRSLLVSMADLLQNVESALQPTAGASGELRKQIEKIDGYMEVQR
ncbi:hypothetical protein BAUCODRAFT_57745, partial [Baudoinia panamericana UAMH 10762]